MSNLSWLPYLVVAGVALLVTLAELIRSFGSSFIPSLKSGWAWLLIIVNIVFALITYLIAVAYLNIGPGLISALICGILFPALLRTRFTLFRPVGDKGDLSIPLDKLYTGIQKRCYREVDSRQAALRAVKAQTLAAHTEEGTLISAINKIIAARQVEEERKADEEYLKKLTKVTDQEMRRYQLAMFLIDIAGGEEDKLLAS